MKIRVKLLHKHSQACRSVHSHPENPWAFFGSRDGSIPLKPGHHKYPLAFYRDAIGRKGRHGGTRWLTLGCNDGDCSGVLMVCEDDLTRSANEALGGLEG